MTKAATTKYYKPRTSPFGQFLLVNKELKVGFFKMKTAIPVLALKQSLIYTLIN